jgi:hypothetical protein
MWLGEAVVLRQPPGLKQVAFGMLAMHRHSLCVAVGKVAIMASSVCLP